MKTRIPKYCRHKGSGQAYVNLDGTRHYLGAHGSEESIERYNRIVAELVASPATKPKRSIVSASWNS